MAEISKLTVGGVTYDLKDTEARNAIDEMLGNLSSAFKYKGSVDEYSNLPDNAEVGDVYNIEEEDAEHEVKAGDNAVWNGTEWDVLSGFIDLSGYVEKETGKGLSTNDYTNAEKTKLAGIADGATDNEGTITGVKMNSTSKGTSGVVDLGTVVTGIKMNNASKAVSSGVVDLGTVITTVDTALNATSTNPVQNKAVNTALGNKVDKVEGKGLSTNDYTNAEKTKLDGIADGANKTTVDTALSATSTNPVQNKVINTALGNKVDKVEGKGLSTNDYTNAEKTKLDGIADGATANEGTITGVKMNSTSKGTSGVVDLGTVVTGIKMNNASKAVSSGVVDLGTVITTVDTELSTTSTNPVQNKVINTALGNKADKSSTVSTMAWSGSGTNAKLTKTIAGTTTDVVTAATIKTAIGSPTKTTFTVTGETLVITNS